MMCNAPQETNSKVIINTRRSLIRTFLDIELLALVLFFMNTANILIHKHNVVTDR